MGKARRRWSVAAWVHHPDRRRHALNIAAVLTGSLMLAIAAIMMAGIKMDGGWSVINWPGGNAEPPPPAAIASDPASSPLPTPLNSGTHTTPEPRRTVTPTPTPTRQVKSSPTPTRQVETHPSDAATEPVLAQATPSAKHSPPGQAKGPRGRHKTPTPGK